MVPLWLKLILLGVGSLAGTYLRYYMEQVIRSGWSIFLINTLACLLMGTVLGYLSTSSWSETHKEWFHLLVLTGFSGGFATFAHYIFYCIEYFKTGHILLSTVYFLTSIVAGFVFMIGGYWFGTKI